MFYRAVIIGVLILPCFLSHEIWGECPPISDPNSYIDNPDTLDNGLFECGDSNLTLYDFTPPIYWERTPNPYTLPDCYAGLIYRSTDPNVPAFIPPEYRGGEGSEDAWTIAAPYEGDSFVVLSTGGLGSANDYPTSSDVKGSSISQEVFLSAGDTIIGAYFFGAGDYTPFNDYGRIYLKPADSNDYPNPRPEFTIAKCDVADVGDFLSTIEWIPFEHTVEANQIGPYYLYCEVADGFDTQLTSYFAIDNLRICQGGQSQADLNDDCDVNLEDFSILSQAWLAFCPDDTNGFDPNDITNDPNIPCQIADIDDSWYVDVNDLIWMSDDWLMPN